MRSLVAAIVFLLNIGSTHAQQLRTSVIAEIVGDKQAGYTTVPLTANNGLLVADCSVKGIKLKMMLDTGSEAVWIDSAMLKPLKLKSLGQYTTIAVGGHKTGDIADIDSMKIGDFDTATTSKILNAVAQEGKRESYDGLLSLQTLGLFGAVIDYSSRSLYLRKPITVAWPKLAGSWKAVSWIDSGVDRQLQADTAPRFEFVDGQLKLTDGGNTKIYAIDYLPGATHDRMYFYDPKESGLIDRKFLAGGLIKVDGETMTVCLLMDLTKMKELPTELKSEAGSGHVLITLKQPGKKPLPADPIKQNLTTRGYTAVPMTRDGGGTIRVMAKNIDADWPMVVDTGANATCIDDGLMKFHNIKPASQVNVSGAGGDVLASVYFLQGYTFGRYQTRAHWQHVQTVGIDLAPFNAERAKQNQVPVIGILGGQELLDGSAIIDLATNTLYLRPVKATIQPKLAGTWILKASVFDGVRSTRSNDNETITWQAERMTFRDGTKEAAFGYHVRDEWERYRIGLYDPKADVKADDFTYLNEGYFKITGDNMKLVRVIDKTKVKTAPTEFDAPKDSGLLLLEYTRKK
jgi:hypothetical protein